jgi:hypothetical protein
MANRLNTTPATIRHKVESVRVMDCHNAFAVTATAVSGAKYHLKRMFADAASAHSVAAKVAVKGTIDPSLWDLVGVVENSAAARHFEKRTAAWHQALAEAA